MTGKDEYSDLSGMADMLSFPHEIRRNYLEDCRIFPAERMPSIGEDVIDTRDERWAMSNSGWYGSAAEFAVAHLGPGDGRHCLVIGSPIPEVIALRNAGWSTTFMDVREPSNPVGLVCNCDATDMTGVFLPDSFDAVSSTCVLCHVGLGRYGDPVKPNGDVLMLAEIARVLRPGGLAAIMVGPALPSTVLRTSALYGNVHRIYSPSEVEQMAIDAGLEQIESKMFPAGEPVNGPCIDNLIDVDDAEVRVRYCYLSVLLRKPE